MRVLQIPAIPLDRMWGHGPVPPLEGALELLHEQAARQHAQRKPGVCTRPHNNHRSPLHGALEMRPHCVGEENGVAATLGSLPKAAHLAVFGDPHRPSTAPT